MEFTQNDLLLFVEKVWLEIEVFYPHEEFFVFVR